MYEVGGMWDRGAEREREQSETEQEMKRGIRRWVVRIIPAGEGIGSPGWTFKQGSCDLVMSDSHSHVTNMLKWHVHKHITYQTHSQSRIQRISPHRHKIHLQNSHHRLVEICDAVPLIKEKKKSETFVQIYQKCNDITEHCFKTNIRFTVCVFMCKCEGV